MRVLSYSLGRNNGLLLFILILFQFLGIFCLGNTFGTTRTDRNRDNPNSIQAEKNTLPFKGSDEAINAQKAVLDNGNSYSNSSETNPQNGDPETEIDNRSSGEKDLLAENGIGSAIEDYVDNQNSDMDSIQDKGTLLDFSNLQDTDSFYANFTEARIALNNRSAECSGGYFQVGMNGATDFGSTAGTISLWIKWQSIEGRFWGQHADFEVRFDESNLVLDWGSDWTLYYTHGFSVTDKWYFWAVTWNEDTDDIYVYEGDETTLPSQAANNDSWGDAVSSLPVTENNIMSSRGVGTYAVNGFIDDFRYWDTDRSLSEIQSDYKTILEGSESNLAHYYKFDNDLTDAAGEADLVASGSYSFSIEAPSVLLIDSPFFFDHEVQFTAATHFLETETLCIKTGSFGGSEELNVTIWTDSEWHIITSADPLLASSWNNYTVAVNKTIFTIKFGGSTTSNDLDQDYWLIDAILLRNEGPGINRTAVMNEDSNVDALDDFGTLDDFVEMQTKDSSYANLTESSPSSNGEWGITSSAFSEFSGHTEYRAMGGISPPESGMNITHLNIRVSGSGTGAIAVYTGGTLSNPVGATKLVEAYGVWLSAGWNQIDVADTPWPADTVTWIMWCKSTSAYVYYSTSSSNRGDFQSVRGRWSVSNPADADETAAMPAQIGPGSFANYWYAVSIDYSAPVDAYLNQEVQWTGVPCQLPYEELCIYAGAKNSESLGVEAWNGSDWENIISDLKANSWNNVSVHSYLDSPTFTIRFVDVTQSSDKNQDYWEIDVVLLCFWNPIPTYLSAWSYPSTAIIATIYYHPSTWHSFFIRWESSIAHEPINATSVEINSSKVHFVDHSLLGTHYFEFLPDTTGISPLNKIRITLSRQAYNSFLYIVTFDVQVAQTDIGSGTSFSNETAINLQFSDKIYFNLSWNDTSNNELLPGADITITGDGAAYLYMVHNENSDYRFVFNATSPGAYEVTIILSKESYADLYYYLTFIIWPNPTGRAGGNIDPDSTIEVAFHESFEFYLLWIDTYHSSYIDDADLTSNETKYMDEGTHSSGNYSFVFNALTLGHFGVNITLTKTGYEPLSFVVSFTVHCSPTYIIASSAPHNTTFGLYYGEKYTFWVQWYDNTTKTLIIDDAPIASEATALYIKLKNSLEDSGNHTFQFCCPIIGLHEVTITFEDPGHSPAVITFWFSVKARPTQFPVVPSSELPIPDSVTAGSTIEGHYVWQENITSQGVAAADVIAYWNGTAAEEIRVEQDEKGMYSIALYTGEVPWGHYNLTLWFNKYGFINQTAMMFVDIIGIPVELELILPSTLIRGEDFIVEALLYQNNGQNLWQTYGVPVNNEPVDFFILVTFDNASTYTYHKSIRTTAQGTATFVLSERETKDIKSIQSLSARFSGSNLHRGAQMSVAPDNLPLVVSRKPSDNRFLDQLWDFVMDHLLVISIVLASLLTILAISAKQVLTYDAIRKRQQAVLDSIHEIRSIRTVIVRHRHGVRLFSQNMISSDERLEEAISGMSSAISSFISEIATRTAREASAGRGERVEFLRMAKGGLHMLQRDGTHTAIIIISETSVGKFMENNVRDLQENIEKRFAAEFERFFSNEQVPRTILAAMVSKHLYTGLLGEIQLDHEKLRSEARQLPSKEQRIIQEIQSLKASELREEGLNLDAITSHLQNQGIPIAKSAEVLLNGYQQGLFLPVSREEA